MLLFCVIFLWGVVVLELDIHHDPTFYRYDKAAVGTTFNVLSYAVELDWATELKLIALTTRPCYASDTNTRIHQTHVNAQDFCTLSIQSHRPWTSTLLILTLKL